MSVAHVLAHVMDFLYPAVCVGCGADATGPLCPACLDDLAELEEAGACPRCAMPLPNDSDPCPYCLNRGVRPFDRILRLGIYADPLKSVIHAIKYHRRWPLADQIADRLLLQPDIRELLESCEILVPMPLYWAKHIRRGYNQADLLARRLASRCRFPARGSARPVVRHPARRILDTPSQTGLHDARQRWLNVRDAFRLVHPRCIQGCRVVVVDDVMTTGSTLRALGRQLVKAEPASLSAVVLAIADPRGRGFEAI